LSSASACFLCLLGSCVWAGVFIGGEDGGGQNPYREDKKRDDAAGDGQNKK